VRLLRRNTLSVYAVYAASIVSGLVVTPIVIHSIGTPAFGVWSFIGSVTIYLSVLDLGVAPSIVRFAAEAHGRRASDDLNEIASTGLAMYAVIGVVTLPVGLVLAWIVPLAIGAPKDLVWDARVTTLLVVVSLAIRFPLGLFNNLLASRQRYDVQNLANFVATVLYALLVALLVPRWGGLVLLGVITLGTTALRLALPLAWLRRELPELRIARSFATRARLRALAAFSSSNFLVQIAQKIVFSTDVIVVGIVLGSTPSGIYSVPARLFALAFGIGTAATSLMFPAFAELAGAGDAGRQQRLLLVGLRAGTALMLLVALPLLLIPDLLIHAWIGNGFRASYAVMAILALVLLVHQPIHVLTQFLIAVGRQRSIAIVSIATTLANVALSFLLAWTVGIWGVAASTLATDLVALAWIVPRIAAPAAAIPARELVRAVARPFLAAGVAAALVLVGVARVWDPQTLLALAPLGVLWVVVAALMLWRFGLAAQERVQFSREFGWGRAAATVVEAP
jgi:O-antigen/teichoic acid export membrane protein